MSNRNNFSPLPFYTEKGEQYKWYAYGRDYIFLAPQKHILAFQIQRQARTEVAPLVEAPSEYTDGYLKADGTLVETTENNCGVAIIDRADITGTSLYIENLPRAPFYADLSSQVQGAQIAFLNSASEVISTLNPSSISQTQWSGDVAIPNNTATIYVLQYNKSVSTENATIYDTELVPKSVQSALVRDADTNEILFSIPISSFVAVNLGEYDYITCNGLTDASYPQGAEKMYIELTDGVEVWYSAFFGWCNPCLKIEWYDTDDLEFDAGAIIYSQGYKNEMYFDAEIGMPEYEFEEEVSERGGYQFPINQISYKRYRFSVLAPEEVCDVMRFIRLSDYIKVTAKGVEYDATSFLITPTWQEQGYLAEIACEFTTNSVVKKTGKGVALKV